MGMGMESKTGKKNAKVDKRNTEFVSREEIKSWRHKNKELKEIRVEGRFGTCLLPQTVIM